WVGEWKSPRIRPQIARNTEGGVRGVTAAAFLARNDATRLRLLLGLRGVGVAVASVMLHFANPRRYPIYDIRVRAALRRLAIRRPIPARGGGRGRFGCAAWCPRRAPSRVPQDARQSALASGRTVARLTVRRRHASRSVFP